MAEQVSVPNGPAAESGHDDLRLVRALEEDIIFGRLAPGARLTEDALLSRFDVTRHFVRQALVQLEQMGMLVRERNKGARVRSLTAEQVRQIYEVRELVQRQAALMIPLPAPDALVAALEAINVEHGRHIAEGYLRGVHETNDRFHLVMFGACGNDYLVRTIEQYMQFSLPVRANTMGDRSQLEISHSQHRADDRDAQGTRPVASGAALRRSSATEQAALSRPAGWEAGRLLPVGGTGRRPQGSRRSSDTPWRGRVKDSCAAPFAGSTVRLSSTESFEAASSVSRASSGTSCGAPMAFHAA